MSRVVNLSMAEADVREQCRKSAIGVSSLEVLQSGGVRLVTSSVDGAEKIRKKLKSKLVRGDVQRTPAMPRTWPWQALAELAQEDGDSVQLRRSWHEWEVDGRERKVVLVVETGLEMRPGHDGFDADALDKLISDVTAEMRASPSPIDRVRIVPQLD